MVWNMIECDGERRECNKITMFRFAIVVHRRSIVVNDLVLFGSHLGVPSDGNLGIFAILV